MASCHDGDDLMALWNLGEVVETSGVTNMDFVYFDDEYIVHWNIWCIFYGTYI